MSLPLILESDPIYYEPQDLNVVQTRNAYLRVPPRVYDEALTTNTPVRGLFTVPRKSRFGNFTICALVVLDYVAGSGTRVVVEEFDGGSGAYLRRTNLGTVGAPNNGLSINTTDVAPGRVNELWYAHQSTTIREFLDSSWEGTGQEYAYSDFTPNIIHPWAIDTVADRLLDSASSEDLQIYELSSGTLLATIPVGGIVLDVFLEDLARCYVITDTGLVVLVDYVREKVLGVARIDFQPGTVAYKRFGWDPYRRLILTLEPTADNADGSATTIIRGYHPTPLGVGIQDPIPLLTPRKGRTVPVLTRCYGNAGEAIGGVKIEQTTTGDGTIATPEKATDGAGWAKFDMVCDDEGTATVDLEAEQ